MKVPQRGFTIVELLAAVSVFILLMLMLVTATNQTGEMWRRSATKIEQFQQARRGYESMTRRISQATLNTYWDYEYPLDGSGNPDRTKVPIGYVRQSELRFRSGLMSKLVGNSGDIIRPSHGIFFQAPLGFVEDETTGEIDRARTHRPLYNLLNTWGFYVEVQDDRTIVPEFLSSRVPSRVRSRLVELMEPSETLRMDNPSQQRDANGNIITADPNWDDPKYIDWFALPVKDRKHTRIVSENVVALIIHPKLSAQDEEARLRAGKADILAPLFDYDSKRYSNQKGADTPPTAKAADGDLNPKNQLPPVVRVTMVAIDENSARRLDQIASGDRDFGLGLANLFTDARRLDDPENGDLVRLERQLIEKRLTYRFFTSNVAIRGAKWSRGQN